MKTVAINIENLCAPCYCSCRHCLLCSQHRATGVDYQRGEAFSRRFYAWLKENRPDLSGMYYVGYCMDFPELSQFAAYFHEQTGMTHLMFDGMAFRDEAEIKSLFTDLQDAGIQEIHFTFYGTEHYHDKFAGRKGDYSYMMRTARIAQDMGLLVSAGVMITMENAAQMEELISLLQNAGIQNIMLLLPHAKGRGYEMSNLRLTEEAYRMLPISVQSRISLNRYQTESQWLQTKNFPEVKQRHLTLSLTEENIERLERMDPSEIIFELEAMDDFFYKQMPDIRSLANQYGQPDNTQLFRFRDLYLQWQKRYLSEHPILPDMTDERCSFSTHIFAE